MASLQSIQRLLQPQSIAVVGGDLAATVIRQCDLIGYKGDIWPVHPRRPQMQGRPCYPSIEALPSTPDAAFLAVPREATIGIVAKLAKRGAGGAVCYASGFAEIGHEGIALQHRLQAAMGDLAIVGPNCYGILNYLDGVTLWPDEQGGQRMEKGVAIIAQSGNIGISLSMQQRSVPLAYLISTGNQAGVTIPEYVDVLLEDERVMAIGIHMEGLDDVVAFSQVAVKALHKRVPIVVIKSGTSELGSQIALSHTRSLAGTDALYDTLFERLGILRVHTLPQFLEALKFLAITGPLPDNRIASISCSGGEAALMADSAERNGLAFPALVPSQEQGLWQVLGERVALGNPLDYHTYIWNDEEAQFQCFSAMLMGEQTITLKILDYPRPDICNLEAWVKTARAFMRAIKHCGVRGVLVSTMQENLPLDEREKLLTYGIAPMLGIEECLIAIRGAVQAYAKHQQAAEIQPLARIGTMGGPITTLDEAQSKRLLEQAGIPALGAVACTKQTAVQTALEIGFPVAVKVLSDTIVHKSDVNGVHLNLRTTESVQQAISQMAYLGDRFLIEPMAPKPLAELILGLTRDPQFGLALVIGAGGILVELFQDSQTLLFPVRRAEVEAAIDTLKIAPILNGYRGQPTADKAALVNTIMQLVQFGEIYADQLHEVDINPLLVLPQGEGVIAVDAVIRMKE